MAVELVGGHCPTLQPLPIKSLKPLGTNPYGEPIFRVVWSESRYYLVGADHTEYDSEGPSNDAVLADRQKDPNVTRITRGYKWLPLYPGRGRWVLEMWKSPFGFTGCSKESWNLLYRDPTTNLLTLGPYPDRGDYAECSAQLSKQPTRDEVIRWIYFIKAGWNYTHAEKAAANREALEKVEKAKVSRFKDMFKDSQQAFNNKPTNIRPGKRTADKVNFARSAEQAGLPRRPGFTTSTPRRAANARNC